MIVIDGLVGYWNSKQGVNGNVWNNIAPSTVGDFNGTLNGATVTNDGMYFGGGSSQATLSLPTQLRQPTDLTFEFRLNLSPSNLNPDVFPYSNNFFIYLYNDAMRIFFDPNGDELPEIYANYSFERNVDTYVTFTYTTSGTVSVWVNGNSIPVISSGDLTDLRFFAEDILTMGYSGDPDFSLIGILDNIRLYNRVLTNAEIVQNYTVGSNVGLDSVGNTYNVSLSDAILSTDKISKRLSIIVTDTIVANETNRENTHKTIQDSITILDSISKSLTRSVLDNVDLGDTEDETVLKALVDSITLTDSFSTLGGKSILLTDSINTSDSISTTKQLNKLFNEFINIMDQSEKQTTQSIRLFDVIVTNENINMFNPNTPELVGTILLRGKRDLFVFLQGQRELVLFMKGGLNMIPNQNFNMVSGDTKTLIIDIKEDLVGASVKWVLFKPGEPEITLIKEGNVIDGKINITLDKGDTEELSGIYKHECEITDQQGNISTVTSGNVAIIKDMI